MPEGAEEQLAAVLLGAVADLRAGRLFAAERGFSEVVTTLEGVSDLDDVRSRALCLLIDARLKLGQLDEAQAGLAQADAMSTAFDAAGRREIAGLRARLSEARRASATQARAEREADALRRWSVDKLRARYGNDPGQLVEVLVKKANAEIDAGAADGVRIAEAALELARSRGDVRGEVLAWLSVARGDPARAGEALEQAWRRAERASEFTLVGLVARAAELQGVTLPEQIGPDLVRVTRVPPGEDGAPEDAMS